MMAHHFLWSYPKNAEILANQFAVGEKYARGENLWSMVRAIAELKSLLIVWDSDFDRDDTEVFTMTVDGTDFRIWELKHPTLPRDKDLFSHKHNHAALRYEIGVSLKYSKVVWINGPFPAGKNSDKGIFNRGLEHRIRDGKMVIADGTYKGSKKIAIPDCLESKMLKNFKSRARLRHETFNSRLKKFSVMEQTFRHGLEKHRSAFEAVCVICQNNMDGGSKLYDI